LQQRSPRAGILLHTEDSGSTWKRIPLSAKLPGAPIKVTALEGKGCAEMATESGAIYVTDNTAYTWKAAVQETVDATLNRTVSSGISGASYYEGSFATIVRSPSGNYVGVSSRGNFYMTWAPGDAAWTPHNRPATRRLQNLGWTADDRLWATTRAGDVLIADKPGVNADTFTNSKISSRGFGLLDIGCAPPRSSTVCLPAFATACANCDCHRCLLPLQSKAHFTIGNCHKPAWHARSFRNDSVCYASGGSGSLFKSVDGGKTFKRSKGLDRVPGNLYEIAFSSPSQGFILGNDGILLRYIGGEA
jgi:photosystem II stability/assembly factor-like uncharacterized protein